MGDGFCDEDAVVALVGGDGWVVVHSGTGVHGMSSVFGDGVRFLRVSAEDLGDYFTSWKGGVEPCWDRK